MTTKPSLRKEIEEKIEHAWRKPKVDLDDRYLLIKSNVLTALSQFEKDIKKQLENIEYGLRFNEIRIQGEREEEQFNISKILELESNWQFLFGEKTICKDVLQRLRGDDGG